MSGNRAVVLVCAGLLALIGRVTALPRLFFVTATPLMLHFGLNLAGHLTRT